MTTVIFENVEIELTQEAYLANEGQYLAAGKDIDGNVWQVEWATKIEWDEEQEKARNGEDFSGWAEDESNACNWDNPINAWIVG